MINIKSIFNSAPECYQSIEDLPVWNWFKLSETNNLIFLLKDHKQPIRKKHIPALKATAEKINEEFVEVFGLSENYRRMLELRREILNTKLDMLVSGDKTLENLIVVMSEELKEVIQEMKGNTIEEVTGYVEKYMKFSLDIYKCSTKQFFTYIELMKKKAKPATINHEQ